MHNTDSTKYTNNSSLYRQGHIYVLVINVTLLKAIPTGGTERILTFDSGYKPTNSVGPMYHSDNQGAYKGGSRAYASSDGVYIQCRENLSTGDVVQGILVYVK